MASNSWPKVSYAKTYTFSAIHSMDHLGGECAEKHEHFYKVRLGATHEIQPHRTGYCHSVYELDEKFLPLVNALEGKDLNALMPMPPSAEAIALWFLANTDPSHCSFVEVECYGFYLVRADRALQRSEWLNKFKYENTA